MNEKKRVYVILGFFKEGYNYEDGCTEEYYAENRSEIEKVKKQVWDDYGDQLDMVTVSEEKEERSFSI